MPKFCDETIKNAKINGEIHPFFKTSRYNNF